MSKEKLEFYIFNIFSSVFKFFGLNFARKFGKFFGLITYYFFPIRKDVVIKNLSFAFPQKTTKEIKSLAKRNYQNIFITFFEFMISPFLTDEQIMNLSNHENADELKKITTNNKGTIFFTGHFGNWELGSFILKMVIDKPLYVLAKKQSNTFINNWLTKARESHGNKMIWLGPSIRHLIEILKNGGIVGIVADQRGAIDSPRINFFNRKTAFPIGSATIAAKLECNIAFVVLVRGIDYSYKFLFEILNQQTLSKELEQRAIEINQSYANFLERVISQNPEQYFWMHNLWKY